MTFSGNGQILEAIIHEWAGLMYECYFLNFVLQ